MSKLTNALIQIKAFNPEHYPVGTAVLITYANTGVLDDPDIKSEVGVIMSYMDSNTVMCLTTARTAARTAISFRPWGDSGIFISVEDVDTERIVLTRLLPESKELEEMDYESAIKEVTG